MASNFWRTSHWRGLTTREHVFGAHAVDRSHGLSIDDIQRLKLYVVDYLSDLAKISQQLIRQRVVATAITYFRRFYLRHDFCSHDPRKVAPACLYLACKAEEAQVQAKVLFQIMRKLAAQRPSWPILDMKELLDLEMVLLDELDYSLSVFSPYRDLVLLLRDQRIAGLAEFAWAVLNDSYKTDMCLLYPPHMLAIAAINTAAAAAKADISSWLAELDIDYATVVTAMRELVFCYKHHRKVMDAAEFERLLLVTSEPVEREAPTLAEQVASRTVLRSALRSAV